MVQSIPLVLRVVDLSVHHERQAWGRIQDQSLYNRILLHHDNLVLLIAEHITEPPATMKQKGNGRRENIGKR
jgi:hypothetical protein